jgi:hypothetical protein
MNRGKRNFGCIRFKFSLMEYLNGNPLTRFILNVSSKEEKGLVLQWLSESDQNKATLHHFEQLVQNMVNQHPQN